MTTDLGTATIKVRLDWTPVLDDLRTMIEATSATPEQVDGLTALAASMGTPPSPKVGDVVNKEDAEEWLDSLPVGAEVTDRDEMGCLWTKSPAGWRYDGGSPWTRDEGIARFAPFTLTHLPETEDTATVPAVEPAPLRVDITATDDSAPSTVMAGRSAITDGAFIRVDRRVTNWGSIHLTRDETLSLAATLTAIAEQK